MPTPDLIDTSAVSRRSFGRNPSHGIAFDEIGISDWNDRVEIDPAIMRPAEVDELIGDSTKARETLGWRPKVGFDELVRMMVRHDIDDQSKRAAGGL